MKSGQSGYNPFSSKFINFYLITECSDHEQKNVGNASLQQNLKVANCKYLDLLITAIYFVY